MQLQCLFDRENKIARFNAFTCFCADLWGFMTKYGFSEDQISYFLEIFH